MRVRITPQAQAQLEERKQWWRQHRDKAPDLFDREFVAAAERIGSSPTSFPVFTEKRGRRIRRCLMPKTQCHLYFEILEDRREISVVAAGGGRRGKPPGFRLQEDAP
jgi:plasmid stabilization system protein ParE